MRRSDWDKVIDAAMTHASEYLASLPERHVYRRPDVDQFRAALGEMPDEGTPAEEVVSELAELMDPYVVGHATGRYFGFVIGGLHPASFGADLLAATWDQNVGLYTVTPGASLVEEAAAAWLLDLLNLPRDSAVGFVTGGQMATFTCLAAARDHVVREVGWNVETDGLQGAPRITTLVKADGHATVNRALRFLGLGDSSAIPVACDEMSRMDVEALREALSRTEGPTIVNIEVVNINTGSMDRYDEIVNVVDEHRARGNPAWVHVDGAVGLFALASPAFGDVLAGIDRCDSWSTDAHKLLNVGYDSGIAITAHQAPHRAAMSSQASYLVQGVGDTRDPLDWNPEHSRRGRGFAVFATLKSLGRKGVAELVDHTCAMARLFAEKISETGLAEIQNEVTFNQVLVRWLDPAGDHDAFNDRVIELIQEDGSVFFSGTTWHGMRLMRISVSDWATDEEDVDRAVAVLTEAAKAAIEI
ncbi:MAG TPA: pyridoxal-dependent decarboxylase [Acidimicrobiia bacterium]|nr:pyridoxal-dependent decarboxylase [Acidimicrobiia bacterium]